MSSSARGSRELPAGRPAALVAWLAAVLVLAGCSIHLDARPPAGVNLSGRWVLAHDLSDDPGRLLAAHRRGRERHAAGDDGDSDGDGGTARHEGPGRPPPAGHGDSGTGAGGGHEFYGRGSLGSPPPSTTFLAQPRELSIEQLPGELKVDADGVPADYGYDDEVLESVGPDLVKRRTGWHEDAFVIDYAPADHQSATRSYQCAAGCSQLVVTTQLKGGRLDGVTLRSVYRRAAGKPRGD